MQLLHREARRGSPRVRRCSLATLLTLGLLVSAGAAPAAAQVPTDDPIPAAAGWVARDLGARATPDGGVLADAVLAFAASGSAGDLAVSTFDRLADVADTFVGSGDSAAGNAAKTVLAASAVDADPTDLGDDGFDAEAALRARIDSDGRVTSIGGTQLFVQSLAILALETTDDRAPASTVDFLLSRVCDDGGFNALDNCVGPAGGSDVDTTAVAVQALLAAERDADAAPAVSWLLGQRDANGALPATDPDANGSALAAQAFRAVGESAAADAAAAFVTSLQKGCDAPVGLQGAIATYPDLDGELRLATTQGVFAEAPRLDLLDVSTAAPDTAFLDCAAGEPCPAGAGVTVVVDFTSLAPGLDAQVACAPGPIASGTTGHDLLEQAGFTTSYGAFSFGDAVCQVDELPVPSSGDPTDTCFEQGFWSYWSAERGGAWDEYQVGGGDSRPAEGTVEGWSWAPGFDGAPPRFDVSALSPAPVDPPPTPPFDRGIARACPGSYDNPFGDISGSVHEQAIRCLAAAGITEGSSDPTRYLPLRTVTRAQLASFLARSFEEATGSALPAGPDRFPDDDGSPHERNIDALAAAGVIQGVDDGTRFAPNDTVTRGQMASLLARFLDLLDDGQVNQSFPPATGDDVFTDDTGLVHAGAIDRLAVQGVIQGRRDGSFGPLDGVRRDQLASFLARALDLAVAAELADPIG